MSLPPPSSPPPGPGLQPDAGVPKELRLELAAPKGLRKLAVGGERYLRLRGSELTFMHSGVLERPFTINGGLVRAAAVDRGTTTGEHGRFPVLHRMINGMVIPARQGIEGWLWTTKQGSALPLLSDYPDDLPNLALLFVKPLDEEQVRGWFKPDWVQALAERSALGKPSVLGLLLCVERPLEAEKAFEAFGVLRDLTEREVPPTMRRHLPSDVPANPRIGRGEDDSRAATSIAPPGF